MLPCNDARCWISARPAERVAGPDDAVRALRRAVDVGRTATVVLVLDAGRRVTDVFVFERLLAGDALDRALEAVRDPAPETGPSIVVATVAPDRPALPTAEERAAWRRLRSGRADGGVDLLDWLIISGHRWRSLAETES